MESDRREIIFGQRTFRIGQRLLLPSGRVAIVVKKHRYEVGFLEVRYEDEPVGVWEPTSIHYKLVTEL